MSVSVKSLGRPDEVREFPNGKGEIVDLDGMVVGRGSLQAGWRWSNDLKPLAGTSSCEVAHTGVVLSGQLHVEMDDGAVTDLSEGDVYVIPSGHDAWVVGDVACVMVDWSGNFQAMPGTRS
jgi:ethanolamine utilization protein EutQ (cupin superfamily)